MSPETFAVQLGALYGRSCDALDELLAAIAAQTEGADYVATWAGLAGELRSSDSDGLAELLAAALLRLLAAAQTRDLAAEEIAHLNARLNLTRAHEEMGTAS